MAGKWPEMPLEECMAAIIDYRGKTPMKTTSGIPLITAKIIKGGRIEKPAEFIDPTDYDEWMRRGIPQAGDVVLTTEAPLGEVAQLDGSKAALAQRVITLRGKDGIIDNTFLKFLLQSRGVQEQLHGRSTGITVHDIRQSELRKVLLSVPPVSEQQSIAHILGTLDDKIELNRRMNETLEAMARALFKSWFVEFLPVRAKMAAKANNPSLLLPQAEPGTWYVYAIECNDGSLYIGQTEDLRQRWIQHVGGKGANWTKQHPPVSVSYWEMQPSREAAVERENWLKTGYGRKWLKQEIAARTQTGDPVRAKAEGNDPLPAPQSEAARQAGGLPKPLADLFPDSFEDSELGEIPNGWHVGMLADVAALNSETWSKDTRPATINYVDLSNTKWGRIESVTTHTRQDAPSRAQRVLRFGDTIL